MAVVIRDFEIVPGTQPPPATPAAPDTGRAPRESHDEVTKSLRHHAERQARVRAY